MLVSVLIFTLIGSFISSNISNDVMGSFSKIMTLLVGVEFIVKQLLEHLKIIKVVITKNIF